MYEEALSQLISPGGLIVLLINSACMISRMSEKIMWREKKHAFVYECERVCSKVCVGNQGNLLMFVL